MQYKSYFNWSGGKDSSLALYHVLRDRHYSVERLLTTVNTENRRISMHGVREVLLEAQADAIGLPLQKIVVPDQPSMEDYEKCMMETMAGLKDENFSHAIFGDIFLDDLRRYREEQLARVHINALFPLWQRNTTELLHEFLDLGFKTIVVCTKAELLDKDFAGRVIDRDFLKDLPAGVDPCGENGEFHSFVFDGPIFKEPVSYAMGEKVFREYAAPKGDTGGNFSDQPKRPSVTGFWYCDLTLPSTVSVVK